MIINNWILMIKETIYKKCFLKNVINEASELAFPRICAFCDRKIHDDFLIKGICRRCLAQIPFRTGDMIKIKCLEEKSIGQDSASFRTLTGIQTNKNSSEKWNIDVIVACKYTDYIRKSLIAMKFYDAAYMKHVFGSIINYVISQQKDSFDGIIPIPLHKSRQIERGYNQAELIAAEISELSGIPLLNDCLVRLRKTKRQSEMGHYSERLQNVSNAFCCTKPEKISGKRILLLDDILTSGETMISAAEAIKIAIEKPGNAKGIKTSDYEIIGLVLASSRK